MLIPARMHELREAHAPLGEAAGDEAIIRKCAWDEDVGSIHLEDGLGFVAEIQQVRHGGLHAKRHLVLRDTGVDLGIADGAEVLAVEGLDVVEHRAARVAADARRVADIGHGIAGTAETHSLVLSRQETVTPVMLEEELAAGLGLIRRGHHDEVWEVLVHRTEAVGEPCTHRRATRNLRARHEERDARGVIHGLGIHRADDAEFVGDGANVR